MKITIKYIREVLGQSLRHEPKKMKAAIKIVAKEIDHKDEQALFRLVVFNEPIAELYTHSYGFHTPSGRGIIDQFSHYYYSL